MKVKVKRKDFINSPDPMDAKNCPLHLALARRLKGRGIYRNDISVSYDTVSINGKLKYDIKGKWQDLNWLKTKWEKVREGFHTTPVYVKLKKVKTC